MFQMEADACVFAGRLEVCSHCFGEDGGAGGVLTERMLPAEGSGGGRGGEGKRGEKVTHATITEEGEESFMSTCCF